MPLPGNFIGPGPKEYTPTTPREISVEEIHAVTDDFAAAAKRSIEAGFDGVEIHGSVHHYAPGYDLYLI